MAKQHMTTTFTQCERWGGGSGIGCAKVYSDNIYIDTRPRLHMRWRDSIIKVFLYKLSVS